MTPQESQKPKGMIEASLAGAPCSAAGVEAELGVTPEKMRELIKPLVVLMHRKRLPYLTIKLDRGIATVITMKPPTDRTQARGTNAPEH